MNEKESKQTNKQIKGIELKLFSYEKKTEANLRLLNLNFVVQL